VFIFVIQLRAIRDDEHNLYEAYLRNFSTIEY